MVLPGLVFPDAFDELEKGQPCSDADKVVFLPCRIRTGLLLKSKGANMNPEGISVNSEKEFMVSVDSAFNVQMTSVLGCRNTTKSEFSANHPFKSLNDTLLTTGIPPSYFFSILFGGFPPIHQEELEGWSLSPLSKYICDKPFPLNTFFRCSSWSGRKPHGSARPPSSCLQIQGR